MLPLLVGWLPAWALFALLMKVVHEMPASSAALHAARLVGVAALLGLVVLRGVARWPWPHPWRWRFMLGHLLAAPLFSFAWLACNNLLVSLWEGRLALVRGPGFLPFFVTGVWLYVMVAGVAYAQRAARLAAEAQAQQARTRLAALRSQLHPHFLFNALHTVVQLIQLNPQAATQATEQLAALLRTTLDNEQDHVRLAEEWALVQRYLALEQLRLGERLQLHAQLDAAALPRALPSLALQTLVENAIRHGVEPRVAATMLHVQAAVEGEHLVITVSDDGAGTTLGANGEPALTAETKGTGLRRLRERLAVLHGSAAALSLRSSPGLGFAATLRLPLSGEPPHG